MRTILLLWTYSLIALQIGVPDGQCAERTESIQSLFDYLEENNLYNGAVLVADHGDVIYKRALGYANFEWRMPNTVDSKFKIGSITKQFTAMLAMQLVGEGQLSLSDPVNKYLPELRNRWAGRVTIHHMLSHTSGIPNFTLLPDFVSTISRTRYTRPEFLDLLLSSSLLDSLHFEPGTSFDYSNTNYFFIGLIVERIEKRPLESIFQEKIFDPLEMTSTGPFDDLCLISHRAYGYEKSPNDIYEPVLHFAMSPKSLPSGGLYSTVEDLFRWHEGIRDYAILNKELTGTYLGAHHEFDDRNGYAYGNYYLECGVNDTDTLVVYMHGGSGPGTTCMFVRIPEADECIVLLHNGGMGRESFLTLVASAIIEVLHGQTLEIPKFDLLGPLAYTTMTKDVSALQAHYGFLKEHRSDIYEFNVQQLSTIGNIVIQLLNDSVKAEAVFQLNLEEYPNEALVYKDLANLYLRDGEDAKALRLLQEALALSKDDEELKKLLEDVERSLQ